MFLTVLTKIVVDHLFVRITFLCRECRWQWLQRKAASFPWRSAVSWPQVSARRRAGHLARRHASGPQHGARDRRDQATLWLRRAGGRHSYADSANWHHQHEWPNPSLPTSPFSLMMETTIRQHQCDDQLRSLQNINLYSFVADEFFKDATLLEDGHHRCQLTKLRTALACQSDNCAWKDFLSLKEQLPLE